MLNSLFFSLLIVKHVLLAQRFHIIWTYWGEGVAVCCKSRMEPTLLPIPVICAQSPEPDKRSNPVSWCKNTEPTENSSIQTLCETIEKKNALSLVNELHQQTGSDPLVT